MIISPCISICKTDPQTGYCYGCGRNNEEKKMWKLEETSDEWKKSNLTDIVLFILLNFFYKEKFRFQLCGYKSL